MVSRSMSEPPPRIPVSTSDFVKGKTDDVVVSTAPVRTPERREIIITLLNVQNVERLINISKKKKIGKVYVTTECGRREEMTKQIDVNKIDVDRGGIAWNVTFEMTFSNIGPGNPPPQDMYLTLCVVAFDCITHFIYITLFLRFTDTAWKHIPHPNLRNHRR